MTLAPVPAEQGSSDCEHCGAPLVADQRYCLSCGQPCSPVRLAFLDVLQSEQARAAAPAPAWLAPQTLELAGYAPAAASGANGWLRRNSGLLSLLSVLVLCLIAGLLVGHWATQGSGQSAARGPQVIKIEGLAAAAPAAAATPAAAPASTKQASSKSSAAKEEAEEAAEAAKETKAEKAPPPAPVKVSPTKIRKITTSTGKKHQEEIESLGAKPIETGG